MDGGCEGGLLTYSLWDVSSPLRFLRQTGHVPCYKSENKTKECQFYWPTKQAKLKIAVAKKGN